MMAMQRKNVMLRMLEEGEISDEDNLEAYADVTRNISLDTLSENATLFSSTSIEEEREREVDRIIHEVQEATSKGNFTELIPGQPPPVLIETMRSDDEETLRLAAVNSSRDRVVHTVVSQHGAENEENEGEEEGEINENANLAGNKPTNVPSYRLPTSSQTNMPYSSHHNWVPLKRVQSGNRGGRYGIPRERIRGGKYHKIIEPLKVTVRNENVKMSNELGWMQIAQQQQQQQQQQSAPTENSDVATRVIDSSDPYGQLLHGLRMRVEASKFAARKENLEDNYEQVGMDIVESDRDSHSQSSPGNNETLNVAHHSLIHARTDLQSADEYGDNEEEDDEHLRAVLLEQVKKRKTARNLSPTLEDGELSSPNSEHEADDGGGVSSAERSKSSRSTKKRRSGRHASGMEQSQQYSERSKNNSAPSSDSDVVLLDDYHSKSYQKRRESLRENTSRRIRRDISPAFDDRSAEDWERMVETEKKQLKEIERKLKHREVQKDITKRKRDKFLERAGRCARELGSIEAEMEVLRGDHEKIRGRLSFLERKFEATQFEESRRETERKAAEREKRKKRAWLESKHIKREGMETDHQPPFTAAQMLPELENIQAMVPDEVTNVVLEQSLPHSTTVIDKEEVSRRTTSSSGMHHSQGGLSRDIDLIELSDSNDSAAVQHDLVSTIREMGQEEEEEEEMDDDQEEAGIEADFVAEPEVSSIRNGENFPPNRRRIIGEGAEGAEVEAPSEKDLNELKKNPLIMFSGYRVCPSFPYHLITHRALSNKLDPLKPLCYYQLLGKCLDQNCQMQHEEDYLMSDEELICSILAQCPTLCPPNKMFSEYAHEILEEHRSKPLGETVANLLSKLPESDRRIKACEMAARCDPPSEKELEELRLFR